MSESELGRFFLSLVLLLFAALATGHVFDRFKLPRVVGEIAGGIVLGPSVLGLFLPSAPGWLFAGFAAQEALLSGFYWIGLVLLMFAAGFKMQGEGPAGSRSTVLALILGALLVPFGLGYLGAPLFVETSRGDPLAFNLVMGIAVAVTSIPVISRIFLDLDLMTTSFARNVVGAATIQDLVLWTLLAVATAIQHGEATDSAGIARVIAITIGYMLASFVFGPALVRGVRRRLFGKLSEAALTSYMLLVCLAFVASASLLSVNIVFAALVAGLVMGRFSSPLLASVKQRIADLALGFFVPIYFALVGLRLDLLHEFDAPLTLVFILASTTVKMTSCMLATRIGGTGWFRALDYGIAMNTRGGPGIVLASVAHAAGIIDERMFTALVLASILTSLATGLWLRWRLVRNPTAFAELKLPTVTWRLNRHKVGPLEPEEVTWLHRARL